jgi:hypothetical protein
MSGFAPLVLSLSKDRLTMSGQSPLVLSLSKDEHRHGRPTMSGSHRKETTELTDEHDS